MKSFLKLIRYYVVALLLGGVRAARDLGVVVGENCRIYTSRFGSEPFLIGIGNNVTVSARVTFITHDGSLGLFSFDDGSRPYLYAKILIGNDVFIGMDTVIMPGVKIGNNVVIGAGSIVTKSIPSGSVVAGNPARWILSYDDYRVKCLIDENRQRADRQEYQKSVTSIARDVYKTDIETPLGR
tara:strand:- start:332 stop:880 length:549 start_codon:yes stop_codon:yes gene_type:complete